VQHGTNIPKSGGTRRNRDGNLLRGRARLLLAAARRDEAQREGHGHSTDHACILAASP
jgi:hypothetical protein